MNEANADGEIKNDAAPTIGALPKLFNQANPVDVEEYQKTQPLPPEINVPCEVYSRIVGYLRPIQNWNAGKQQEFADRVVYRVPNDLPEANPRALLATPFEVL